MTAVRFDAVHAAYGPYKALNGLTLRIEQGESVALLGRNGAGKSTFARVASALVPIESGVAEVLGRDVRRCSTHELARAGVVHLPEGAALFGGLSIEENLSLRAGRSRGQVAAALAMLPPTLQERRRSRAASLSGGQQRLVAVAGALAASPSLLLADEPALGLAPAAATEVYAAIAASRRDATTLVVIETQIDRVRALCRRVIVFDKGTVAADTTIDDEATIRAALLGGAGAISA